MNEYFSKFSDIENRNMMDEKKIKHTRKFKIHNLSQCKIKILGNESI